MRHIWKAVFLLPLAGLISPHAMAENGVEKPKVSMAIGAPGSFPILPVALASKLGYFKDEGLTPDLISFAGGGPQLMSIVGGSADMGLVSYEHTIELQARGQYIVNFAQDNVTPGYVFGVRSDLASKYKSPKDLKGMKIGVTSPGSATSNFVLYLIKGAGLTPNDIGIIGVGSGAQVTANIDHKEIDAISNLDPIMTLLESSGRIKIELDLRTKEATQQVFHGLMGGLGWSAKPDFIKNNPHTVQAVTNAMIRTLMWMQKATPEQVADTLPPEFLQGDRKIWLLAYSKERGGYSTDGRLPQEGPKVALAYASSYDDAVAKAKIDLAKTYDRHFVEAALQKLKK